MRLIAMADPTTDAQPDVSPHAEADPPRVPARARRGDLDARVRQLEATVADLKENAPTEEGVTNRVLARLQEMAGTPRPLVAPGVFYDETGPVQPPPAPEPPKGVVLTPPPPPPDPARRAWFLFQLWAEFRLMTRMYFDPRYRVSRTAQFVVPVVVVLFALNYFTFAVWLTIPLVSQVAERVIGVLLGVFLYKVLSRELGRYRDVLDWWSKNPR